MLENKYTLLVLFAFAYFFMDESIISCMSIAAVSYLIAKGLYLTHLHTPNEKLKMIEQKLNPIFSKFPSN